MTGVNLVKPLDINHLKPLGVRGASLDITHASEERCHTYPEELVAPLQESSR